MQNILDELENQCRKTFLKYLPNEAQLSRGKMWEVGLLAVLNFFQKIRGGVVVSYPIRYAEYGNGNDFHSPLLSFPFLCVLSEEFILVNSPLTPVCRAETFSDML